MQLSGGSAGSEGHHLRAAEDRLRRGVRAQQQRQHREAQVHVHPRLQEAGLHRTFAAVRFALKESGKGRVSPPSRSPPQNHVNPAVDFTQIPPGMLALDNMLYFARHHQDAYIRVSGRLPHPGNALPLPEPQQSFISAQASLPTDLVFSPVLDLLIELWLSGSPKGRDSCVFCCVFQSCYITSVH